VLSAPSVRPASSTDVPAIRDIAARLATGGIRPWRTVAQMEEAYTALIVGALARAEAGEAVLVAELEGRVVGVMYLQTLIEGAGQARHGHVCDLAVAVDAEGRGVGRALLDAAERWTRERGLGHLTLNVFADNPRALALYERAGFRTDWVRLARSLDAPAD
jgi:ribosomal protein S18 acetylase RimI-like enzyme